MLEVASLAATFLSFALVHLAHARRARDRLGVRLGLYALAFAALAWGVLAWERSEDLTAALLVSFSALCATASLFVVLVPVAPRLLWSLTAASAAWVLVALVGG
jgi:hypothetical protein